MKFIIFILIISSIAGCDLFETREAEQPDAPRDDFQPAVTTDLLIQNLVNSLRDKNVTNYLACFSDSSFSNRSFRFSASSEALSQFPELAQNWSLENEEQYFLNMANKIKDDLPITLSLSNVVSSTQGDSVIYSAMYILNVPHSESFPVIYQGDLQFTMIRDSRTVYVISYWQDNKPDEGSSWSELKGHFYQ
ncbi:MAG: hypothetical protein Kow0098_16860 [Ignavibacteriaceae bacterium]